MQRWDSSAAWEGLGSDMRMENMGLERISGFAGLAGHGRSWGAWCTHGKPNGVFWGNRPCYLWKKLCWLYEKKYGNIAGSLL